MIIDNLISNLVEKHPELLDTFEGGSWEELIEGSYSEASTVSILRNIIEYAVHDGYLESDQFLLRRFGIYTIGKVNLADWNNYEFPLLDGETIESYSKERLFRTRVVTPSRLSKKGIRNLKIGVGVASILAVAVIGSIWTQNSLKQSVSSKKTEIKTVRRTADNVAKPKVNKETVVKKEVVDNNKASKTEVRGDIPKQKDEVVKEANVNVVQPSSSSNQPSVSQSNNVAPSNTSSNVVASNQKNNAVLEKPAESKPAVDVPKETAKVDEKPSQPKEVDMFDGVNITPEAHLIPNVNESAKVDEVVDNQSDKEASQWDF